MRLGGFAFVMTVLALPALAAAQTYSGSAGSVVRPAGLGWRNNVVVPDGPCGCAMPVRTDCYDQACPSCCGFQPLCVFSKIHRMLDCLLPCNRCGGGLAHGCLLGGRRCGVSCCETVGPGCSSAVPMLSDPFIDDPIPPKPQAGSDVRRLPPASAHSPMVTRSKPAAPARAPTPPRTSPWKTTSHTALGAGSAQAGTGQRGPAATRPTVNPAEQSILRRTSAEEFGAEPEPLHIDSRRALPIIRSQSPSEDETPSNPLR